MFFVDADMRCGHIVIATDELVGKNNPSQSNQSQNNPEQNKSAQIKTIHTPAAMRPGPHG